MRSHASEDSIVASKSLASRLARLIQPNVRSTTQRLGNTMKALDLLVIALDDGDRDAARLKRGALRLVAIVA